MKKKKKTVQFDDLLNDFFASLETGDENQVLENYIKDFPEFEAELLEAATYQRTVSEIPDYEYSNEEEETLNLRTQSIVQNLLYKYRQNDLTLQSEAMKVDEVSPIVDLMEVIEGKGFTLQTFAKITRLPEDIIETFNNREVRFGSIVRQAIINVASALGVPVETIDDYLLKLTKLQPMHARADEPIQFDSQMEFLEIIKYDPDISEEDRHYWLNQKPQEEEQSEIK